MSKKGKGASKNSPLNGQNSEVRHKSPQVQMVRPLGSPNITDQKATPDMPDANAASSFVTRSGIPDLENTSRPDANRSPAEHDNFGLISGANTADLPSRSADDTMSGYQFGDIAFPPETDLTPQFEVSPSIVGSPENALSGKPAAFARQTQTSRIVHTPNLQPPALFGQTLPQPNLTPQMLQYFATVLQTMQGAGPPPVTSAYPNLHYPTGFPMPLGYSEPRPLNMPCGNPTFENIDPALLPSGPLVFANQVSHTAMGPQLEIQPPTYTPNKTPAKTSPMKRRAVQPNTDTPSRSSKRARRTPKKLDL